MMFVAWCVGLALAAEPSAPDATDDAATEARPTVAERARALWDAMPDPKPGAAEGPLYEGSFDRAPVPHWRVELPGPTLQSAVHTERARPVVDDDSVYVGSAAGEGLFRLDRRNGNVLQTYPASGSVESEPVVTDDRVYFTDTGGHTACYTRDGERLWDHDSKAPIVVRPTLAGGLVIVTNVDDLVVALDADTGELVWRHQQPPDLSRKADLALYAAPPAVVVNGEVYVGFSDGSVVALGLEGGDVRWQTRVGEGRYPDIVAEPAVDDGMLYVSGYFKPLVALDPVTRQVRWSLDYGAAAPVVLHTPSDPTLPPRLVIHPGTDGTLRAVRPSDGEIVWAWRSPDRGALTPVVSTDAGLLVASATGTIQLVDGDTGQVRWRHRPTHTLSGISSPPTVAGRQLLFATNAGYLYSMLAPAPKPPPPARKLPTRTDGER